MNLQEFESQYRETMDQTLNELQAAALLLAQVQMKISEVGNYVQYISETVEEFIVEEKAQ
ncbi:hypothetical protein [Nostoc sp. UHCC 0302]|uniref:hypothetical protein n=1 Tax=Nostoc sp. UHCC 0302 TaxID=3134896 RepID=UPI00311C9170